jgi:hypothetical protein
MRRGGARGRDLTVGRIIAQAWRGELCSGEPGEIVPGLQRGSGRYLDSCAALAFADGSALQNQWVMSESPVALFLEWITVRLSAPTRELAGQKHDPKGKCSVQ